MFHPCSQNSLLCEVGLVLVSDSKSLEAVKFRLLDAFNLETLILDSLADLLALLEVVKTLLLLALSVHSNLVTRNKDGQKQLYKDSS